MPSSAPDGCRKATRRSDLRSWLGRVDPALFYLAGRAAQIIDWHQGHRFCGRCGTEMADHDTDRARICPECGLVNYPRLSPSIIVLVTRGEEMLLARNANWPTGMYSTLAGFVEPGESIEQTVHREVAEEVGIRVKDLRYLGSQSWPFPNSLMLGFHAAYEAGEIVCQDGEIADARWFRYDAAAERAPGHCDLALADRRVHRAAAGRRERLSCVTLGHSTGVAGRLALWNMAMSANAHIR
jgi:NAD+ diphosphatase